MVSKVASTSDLQMMATMRRTGVFTATSPLFEKKNVPEFLFVFLHFLDYLPCTSSYLPHPQLCISKFYLFFEQTFKNAVYSRK